MLFFSSISVTPKITSWLALQKSFLMVSKGAFLELQGKYPLHFAVYTNDLVVLKKTIEENDEVDLNKLDVRGRTPLMLAVTLGHKEIALELLRRGADADAQNKEMWSISHEAISIGDPELIKEVIKYRDFQRNVKYAESIKKILETLKDTPDFYSEMSWEFSSWVPFVSKMCPSDTYKIFKSGSFVRIDTTLVGFEGTTWRRGNQTFLFRLIDRDGTSIPQVIVMDHNNKTANIQTLTLDDTLDEFEPPEEAVTYRMTTPISTTYIDVDKIGFERSRGGFLSWISSNERNEIVDGHECKVFNASNVDLVTKTRTEHLTDEDKARFKQEETSNPLSSVLNMVRSETTENTYGTIPEQGGYTAFEYLDKEFDLVVDIGKPKHVGRRSNSFKATLWLAEEYPLKLQEQVIPIVDLMASNSAHFARLNNFIRLQLPAGFPVKIEIPLFHVVSAKITFGNVNKPGRYVTPLEEGGESVSAVSIDDSVFEIPSQYRVIDDSQTGWWNDEIGEANTQARPTIHHHHHPPSAQQQEEMLLQLAIQQSLREANGLPFSEDLSPPAYQFDQFASGSSVYIDPMADQEARELAIAIQESLRLNGEAPIGEASPDDVQLTFEEAPQVDDLSLALRLSQAEEERRAAEIEDEERELERILELSKMEK